MNHQWLTALSILAGIQVLGSASASHAHHIQGICFFNRKTMPCSISKEPYSLKLLNADGTTLQFFYAQAIDHFIGPQQSLWKISYDRPQGIYLQHQTGDQVGFMKEY